MLNPSMNGSHSSEDSTNNSSLLRRNLRRKPETNAGEVQASHSGVELSDDKHRPMYYASSHGRYDPGQTVLSYKADPGFVLSNKPVKRKKIPYIPSRRGGVVGPELDRSVLVRNIPIIFVKQFEAARWKVRRYKNGLISKVYETLFGHRVTLPDEYRPKHGCFPTINWNDTQVKTWTEFAHWMGIQYHGKHEYSFPKGTLGKVVADTYYTNPTSKWPWPFEKGYSREDLPYLEVHSRSHKRSETSRVERSFKRIKKLVVKPIDISSFLQERRVIPRRQISAEWNKFRGCSFKQYRDSIPYCLTVNVRNTFPVSTFMLEVIKKLFSRVSKLVPTLPWVPQVKPEFSEPLKVVPSVDSIRRHKARLTATLGGDGRVYLTRAKIASVQSIPFPERRRALSVLSSIQSEIDKDEDTFVANHGVSFSLGDWEF